MKVVIFLFTTNFITVLESSQPPVQQVQRYSAQIVRLTTHFFTAMLLRISKAFLPFLYTPLGSSAGAQKQDR
jgi:hypothetical protein